MSDAQHTSKQVQVLEWLLEQEAQNPSADAARFGRFKQELFGQLESLEVRVPNQSADAVTVLYSGKLGSTESWRVAEETGRASGGQVLTIGKTELGAMLNSRDVKGALNQTLGPEGKHLYRRLSPASAPTAVRPRASGTAPASAWPRLRKAMCARSHRRPKTTRCLQARGCPSC